MDNVADILSSLSEEDMQQLSNMAQELFGKAQAGEGKAHEEGEGVSFDTGGLNLGALSALALPKEDERTRLIAALKPMLSDERQHRADQAIKLLHLVSLLPALKESGLLDQFLG